ncbi:hypothetical protein PC119_g18382 [Phytophthora cactorum]|uniref:Uncharacterized protein n=1 Tax=Phytophthora cactorum TaxID=29920 RepID=A0A8T1BEK3_9STRA|nr:hypothetical protein PC111_g16139 [Phytophthora cactorum]KAG2848990.1 hypothetical protein PC113_g17469 [Phytophthora cactorum]KAG2898553.1 hypothetical protein PC115_g16810 [Phytophthora cactorum]KAG2993815.1 hypothetical protein PC119_g18382 [Phytophthora cactorum]KAG3072684.1 hypothetical protein PC122_g15147 [Phytophthora cactorum]
MNGDVDGPVPGLSRPPLPPKSRPINRSRKQREREVPDVDWERSLQHFAAAVSDDLDDLHARFLQENELTFAAWKQLWADARMSAAFHVEFWESSPTKTHKTILQQTLDALVCCIEEHDGAFEIAADVATLIGRVFALYCAYSVQLGDPKHKIDVDPQAWTALLTVNFVVCGAGASLFPTAAREVRSIIHRLVVEEKAFLRCLQGFGPSVRVRNRAVRGQTAGQAQDLTLAVDNATEEDAPLKQNTVEQLKYLNDHYQELMSRARSAGPSVSGTGAGQTGRRGTPALSASRSSTQEAGNDGDDLARALTAYVGYKANEEARRSDRVVRAAAAREYDESRTILEQVSSEHDDRNYDLDLSDRGSVVSVFPSPMARSTTSIPRKSWRRRDSGSSEDFLAQLESELHADISSEQGEPATTVLTTRNKQTSALSEVSEADSDALADLERELEQSVDAVSPQNGGKTIPKKLSPPVRRKRDRPTANTASRVEQTTALAPRRSIAEHREKKSSAVSEVSEADSDALADLERELEQSVELVSRKAPENPSPLPRRKRGRESAATGIVPRKNDRTANSTQNLVHAVTLENARPKAKRARSKSVASTMSFADSWAVASTADSDGLAEIQAELDAIPTLAGPLETAPKKFSRARDTQQRPSDVAVQLPAAKSKAKPRVKRPTRQSSACGQKHKSNAVDVVRDRQNHPVQSTDQRLERRATSLPVVSDSTVWTPQFQAEVDISGGKTTTRVTASARESSAAYEIRLRRSSRLSSVASEADSNALEELERELSATTATLGSAMLPSAPSPTKTRSRKRNVKPSPVQRSTRNNAKKQRPNEMDTSTAAAAKQRASKSGPKAPQQPSRMSFVLSDNESDGLAELVAELDTTVATQTITVVQRKRSPVVKRPSPSSTRRKKSPASPKGVPSRSALLHSTAPPRALAPVADVGLRRSARLSSLASDTESDGLEDLMAELDSSPAASKPLRVNTANPRARAGTTRRQQTRAQGTKSKQSQAKEGPKATRTPRAPQAKQKRAAVETEVAKPSTRQPLVAPNWRQNCKHNMTRKGVAPL